MSFLFNLSWNQTVKKCFGHRILWTLRLKGTEKSHMIRLEAKWPSTKKGVEFACRSRVNQESSNTIITCLHSTFCLSPPLSRVLQFLYSFSLQSLVIAGLGDLSRPANQLSLGQSASLLATGLIWSRYSLVIIPKNYSLFSVNVFVALTQIIQLGRAYNYSLQEKADAEKKTKSEAPTEVAAATTKN